MRALTGRLAAGLLLGLTYAAFISLGLPDSALGLSWPLMRLDWGQPLPALGLVTLTLTLIASVSGFTSTSILKRLGTGRVVWLSGLLTGAALLGIGFAPGYAWLLVAAVPLGFGAGSVDAGLNHYAAVHFSSRHMNWLHAFWGVGAWLGPFLLALHLGGGAGWRPGFWTLGAIQLALAGVFFAASGLWERPGSGAEAAAPGHPGETPGPRRTSVPAWTAWAAPLLYFFYAALESGTALWAASVLMENRGLDPGSAALWVSLFYGALMGGRFLAGLVSGRLGNRLLVRLGLSLALVGAGLCAWPGGPAEAALAGLVLLGLGCAPVYPGLMHEAPRRFAPDLARKVVGRQMGFSSLGGALLPAGLGLAAGTWGLSWVFPLIALTAALMLILSEALNSRT